MSFQTGLSGLNASSKSLDVIGNNIANANTVGMKSSRAEFADIVASSLGAGGGGNGAGIGVSVATVSQQFTQGNVNITGNSLDVAVNGGGFFQVTKTNGSIAYSRDGQFKLDKDGNLLTNTGAFVMGYPTDATGAASSSSSTQKITLPTAAPIPAKATTTIIAEFNLDARAKDATQAAAAGQPVSPRSKYGTSVTVYDTQGVASTVNLYFVKVDAAALDPATGLPFGPNKWDVFAGLDNPAAVPPVVFNNLGPIVFNTSGTVTGPVLGNGVGITIPGGTIPSSNPNEPTGFIPTPIDVTLDKVTQFGVNFSVTNLAQDGYTAGEFTNLNIDGKGVISTSYSNGQTLKTGGMIALADFRNLQGLAPIGNGEYLETFKSGSVVLGQPGVGKFGELRAGAVEESNVDITSELVNMMTAQRNYQANAQTIKTQDQIMSTLVNLR